MLLLGDMDEIQFIMTCENDRLAEQIGAVILERFTHQFHPLSGQLTPGYMICSSVQFVSAELTLLADA